MRRFGCLIPLWAKEDRIHQPLIKEGHVDSEMYTNTSIRSIRSTVGQLLEPMQPNKSAESTMSISNQVGII